jgi:hypothetical protein
MGQGVAPNASQVHAGSQGICYFDSENRAMVFLNQNFVETGRMYLPENVQGSAWPAPDWSTVYYCTEQGIHAMDLQTGIARLLVEETAVHQEVTGVFGTEKCCVVKLRLQKDNGKQCWSILLPVVF